MATTTHQISWESFEKLPDSDGLHRELIEGDLQVLPPPKSGHSKIAKRMYTALLRIEGSAVGQTYMRAGYQLSADRRNWIQPDVSFLRSERVHDTADSDYFTGAPDLAVEIVSPSESAADLNRKAELLLQAGSLAVWVIYPQQREVWVFVSGGASFRKGIGEALSLPELLGAWEFPVADLFEDRVEG